MRTKFFNLSMLSVLGLFISQNALAAPLNDPSIRLNNPNTQLSNNTHSVNPQKNVMFSKISPFLRYAYTDFRFNSTTGQNYSRYQGHANSGMLGGDNVQILPNLTAGVAVLTVNTALHSQFSVIPGAPTNTATTINNDTLFAHFSKIFTKNFLVDLAGAYGENRIRSTSTINPGTNNTALSYSRSKSANGFVTLSGFYGLNWKKYSLGLSGLGLYNQLHNNQFNIQSFNSQPTLFVPSLTNRLFLLSEGAELGYQYTQEIRPFINGGLIQLPFYKTSPNAVTPVVNGLIPQLNANKGGYRLGGGISYVKNRFLLRIEEQYYNSASTFISWQTAVLVKYSFA